MWLVRACKRVQLTYWNRDRMVDILKMTFKMHFLEWKFWNWKSNFIEKFIEKKMCIWWCCHFAESVSMMMLLKNVYLLFKSQYYKNDNDWLQNRYSRFNKEHICNKQIISSIRNDMMDLHPRYGTETCIVIYNAMQRIWQHGKCYFFLIRAQVQGIDSSLSSCCNILITFILCGYYIYRPVIITACTTWRKLNFHELCVCLHTIKSHWPTG